MGQSHTFDITINVTMSPPAGHAGQEVEAAAGLTPGHAEELAQKVQGAVARAVSTVQQSGSPNR